MRKLLRFPHLVVNSSFEIKKILNILAHQVLDLRRAKSPLFSDSDRGNLQRLCPQANRSRRNTKQIRHFAGCQQALCVMRSLKK
jgi:hypothetical protein